jgi:large subunit ribosomal protein L2
MAVKTFRPLTPSLRYKMYNGYEQLSADTPYAPLTVIKKKRSGRNNMGHITVRHRGGGYRTYYRVIDFRRDKRNIPAEVETIEYDPNRTCFIALVKYIDGERRYILATVNMKQGMKIIAADQCEIVEGNCMLLKHIPVGMMVHNIEIRKGRGGQIARSAGAYAEIAAKEGDMVQLKFPSSEIRNVRETCYATLGQVSNPEHMNIVLGSAGRTRWRGRRPHVRGVAMNPVDHPMGGGEAKSKGGGGRHHPRSPWGQNAKGLKTRKAKKASSIYIVRRRTKKRRIK